MLDKCQPTRHLSFAFYAVVDMFVRTTIVLLKARIIFGMIIAEIAIEVLVRIDIMLV